MKQTPVILCALPLLAGLTAKPDVLELKNGQVLSGNYLGGTAGTIRFATSSGTQVIETRPALAGHRALAQNAVDEIEVVRSVLKADRKVVMAEGMQLTDRESSAFWPLYREYRAAMDKVGDGRLELVLEYAELYPNVPEEHAKQMLKKYAALEEKSVGVRNKYSKKLAKVLPASKVLRFAQLENRLDLALRVQLAAHIPLMPTQSNGN